MSAVLGVSAYYHDAAAALAIDGRIVAAQHEERLSRIKNDASLPVRAMAAVLELGGVDARDLDAVVFYENPYAKLERVLVGTLEAFPRALRQFPRALGSQLGHKIWVVDALADSLGVERTRIELAHHHESHAASAFYPSPFSSAAVVVVDAVGEDACTSIWHAKADGHVTEAARIDYPQSLGLFYAAMTAYFGFMVNDGEYKVMGLAAFGGDRRRDELARVMRLSGDGSYTLALDYFDRFTGTELGFGAKLEQLLGPARRPGKRWDFDDPEDKRYADVAYATQQLLEEAMLGIVVEARRRTGERDLCLAGGVALNAVANRRIAREAGFDRVFVQPAAGDAGGALGAALLGAVKRGAPRCGPMTHALGVASQAQHVTTHARALGLNTERVSDPLQAIADAVARDEVVAWVHGRCEWGPRALGQRSILATPTHAETRERLNRAVKKREPFRPFAPVVRDADYATYFEGAPDLMTPFMTTIADVRNRDALQAVTHVDGTARVQTVAPDTAMAQLLARLEIPVLLNTSLNGPGEPMVATVTDALSFFVRHGVDRMVIEDMVLTRC